MASTPDLALLALRAYSTPNAADGSNTELNRPAIPTGWIEKEWYADDGTGFSYGVYQNGTEILISYAGTNENEDWLTNIVNGIGLGSTQTTKAALAYLQAKYGSNITLPIGIYGEQAYQAALLYQRVKADPVLSDNISFTGHSLSGGLASVMAVWFDRLVYGFAPAPFEKSADSTQSTGLFAPCYEVATKNIAACSSNTRARGRFRKVCPMDAGLQHAHARTELSQ